jgi:transcription termination/antitermination protein NusG
MRYPKRGIQIVEEPAWYVVYAWLRNEARIESALQNKGIETYLPRVIVPSRRRDRKVLLKLPVFPGYLFVHSHLETAVYHEIIKQPGVICILGNNGKLVPVPDIQIQSLKAIMASDKPYYPLAHLEIGKQVRIIDGPLSGVVGIIKKQREKKRRIVVAVELFKRSLAVELDDESVECWS